MPRLDAQVREDFSLITGPGHSRVTPNRDDGNADPVSQHRASQVNTYIRFATKVSLLPVIEESRDACFWFVDMAYR